MIRRDDKTLRWLLQPVERWLLDPATTEFAINEPRVAWVEQGGVWRPVETPCDLDALWDLGVYVAGFRGQDFTRSWPLCATSLPYGHRVQLVGEPNVIEGTFSLTARKGSEFKPTLGYLAGKGTLAAAAPGGEPVGSRKAREEAARLYRSGDREGWLRHCVRHHMTFLIVGRTGSGKTTVAKALAADIPDEERTVTIEDADELKITQPNRVRTLYDKDGKGESKVGAEHLLEASLRMNPRWVLLGELRDRSAWTFLRGAAADHPTITTCHGDSCEGGFEAVRLMVKTSEAGRTLADLDILRMLNRVVDVVLHCDRTDTPEGSVYSVDETWFRGVDAPLGITREAMAA